jgi:hypothetical protein
VAVGACFTLFFGVAFFFGQDFKGVLDVIKGIIEGALFSGIIMLVSCIVVLVRARSGLQLYVFLLLMPVIFFIHYVSVVYIAHTDYLPLIACLYVAIAIAIPRLVLRL